MRKAINLAVIEEKRILLISEEDGIWTLPGGKPENGEEDYGCLRRELSKELPQMRYIILGYFGAQIGRTPRTGDELEVKVYLGKLEGEVGSPAMEIKTTKFVTYSESQRLNVSPITKTFLDSFRSRGRI